MAVTNMTVRADFPFPISCLSVCDPRHRKVCECPSPKKLIVCLHVTHSFPSSWVTWVTWVPLRDQGANSQRCQKMAVVKVTNQQQAIPLGNHSQETRRVTHALCVDLTRGAETKPGHPAGLGIVHTAVSFSCWTCLRPCSRALVLGDQSAVPCPSPVKNLP